MCREKNAAGKWWLGVVIVGLILVGVGFLVKANVEREKILEKYPDRGLPRIDIKLDGVSLEEIDEGSKETRYEGNEVVLYDGSGFSEYDGVTVKGRGNGTWVQEKKPYQIKFDKKVDLLGMGKARKWYLLANAMDETNLRNEEAFEIAEMLGMEYVLDGEFVELYVDEEYRGLYYLTHAVEVDKQVVDLKSPLGVLVELDNLYWGVEEHYVTENGDHLVIKDMVAEENKTVAMEDFLRTYNEFEMAVSERNYEKINKLVDVRSFAQYYLLSEFTVNPDAYWTSFYFYKDGVEDKIHAGPGWDFDLTFGNKSWENWLGEKFHSPTETMARKSEILPKEFYDEMGDLSSYQASLSLSRIIFDLMEVPEFQDEVRAVYQERLQGRLSELLYGLEKETAKIRRAASADMEKWSEDDYDFGTEVRKMMEWIEARYEYFEKTYGAEKTMSVKTL